MDFGNMGGQFWRPLSPIPSTRQGYSAEFLDSLQLKAVEKVLGRVPA
jgi:hypothetical protein